MTEYSNAPVTPVSDLSRFAQIDICVGNSMQLWSGYNRGTDSNVVRGLDLQKYRNSVKNKSSNLHMVFNGKVSKVV
jgi:hypothetical protein